MTVTESSVSRPFSFGDTFGKGLSVYGRNFIAFTLVAVLIYVPVLVWALLLIEGVIDYSRMTQLGMTGLTLLAQAFVTGVLFYSSTEVLRGRPPAIGRGFAVAGRRLPAILGVAILSAIGIAIGSLLLIIPGLIVMTGLWVAEPVTILEKRPVMESLSRSWELVRGNGWRVFAIILIFALLTGVPARVLERMALTGDVDPMVAFLSPLVIGVFSAAASAAVTAVGYHNLRIEKEGVDMDEIAAAFD